MKFRVKPQAYGGRRSLPRRDDSESEREDPRLWYAILAVILLAAAWFRLHDLGRTSLWLDEALSWTQSRGTLLHLVQATAEDNYPPLHNLVLWVTMALLGDSETALRLPSALFGIANIYALYRLGMVLWDRLTGTFAAILLSFSALHIWYSQEARMYSLLALASTLFVLTTIRLVEEPRRSRAVLAGAAGVLLLYSHVYGAFVWASVNGTVLVWLGLRRPGMAIGWRTWLIPQTVAGALFVPWAIVLAQRAANNTGLSFIPEPTGSAVLFQFAMLASGWTALVVLSTLSLLSLIRLTRGTAEPPHAGAARPGLSIQWDCNWRHGLLLTWLIAPALVGYIVSSVAQPILLFRYLICSLPAFHLLAARGLRSMSPNKTIAGGLMLATIAASFFADLGSEADGLKLGDRFVVVREDYRGAAAAFAEQSQPSDEVIFMAGEIATPFRYYFRSPLRYDQAQRSAEISERVLTENDRLWVIGSHFDQSELLDLLRRAQASHSDMARHRSFWIEMFLFTRARASPVVPPKP